MLPGATDARNLPLRRSLKALRSVPPVTHRAPPHLVVGPTAAIIHLRRAKLSSPLRQLSFLGDICARGALRDFSGPDRCRSPRRNSRVVARGTRMGSHREVWAARSHRLPPAALEGAGAFSAFVAAGLVRSLGLLVGIGRLLPYLSGLAKEISWPSGSWMWKWRSRQGAFLGGNSGVRPAARAAAWKASTSST